LHHFGHLSFSEKFYRFATTFRHLQLAAHLCPWIRPSFLGQQASHLRRPCPRNICIRLNCSPPFFIFPCACCNYSNSISPSYSRMQAILEISWALILMLMSDHLISTTHAAVIPHAARRDPTAGQSVQSHGMSTEALLTLVGVCVAVFGTALTLVLSWPSLKVRWGLCSSRRPHPRQRFRSSSPGTSLDDDSRLIPRR
jgi:hypothetical protein